VPRALRPHKELLIAWTLLLLDGDALHGYRLHQGLRARGLDLQSTSLYRWLRKFEHERWIASYWSEPVDGPRRRMYRLTADGHRTLHELSGLSAAMRDTYSTFLHAHDRALGHRDDAGDAAAPAPGDAPMPTSGAVMSAPALRPLRPHKELLVGWLLLHLDAGSTYGYDLRRAFAAHGLSTDPSALYRMLRRLEADRWVQSRWLSAAAGPRRRFYRLTARGRRKLDEIAVLIAAIRDSHDTYLREYARARRPREAASALGSADDALAVARHRVTAVDDGDVPA
jgi:PadR family transcriptional regulator PadR